MSAPQNNLIFHKEFVWLLGAFHGAWSSLELITSYGIGKYLESSHEQTHILTAGMEFGRKAALLRNLVYRSNDPKKSEIIGLIGKIQNGSKRNVFAHAIIVSNPTTVTFIDRSRGGDYSATEHRFTLEEWLQHVTNFTNDATALQRSLAVSTSVVHDFAMAALSVNTKSTKSPTPPIVKA